MICLPELNVLPLVSIVGRPNVGKSCLFNRIIGRQLAVVDNYEGLTRDRNYAQASWNGVEFTVTDTGGLAPTSKEALTSEIRRQVDIAAEESDVIIFIVDAGTGPTDLDEIIARHLRRTQSEKIFLAVNKAESPRALDDINLYFSLGLGDPLPISALHGKGVADLLDVIVDRLRKLDKVKRGQGVA
ncbi:MAG: GTP-binding protein, partial [Chitinivibrionales bacterium]|nr:GTP-binding protein [Chitinivibrionales bacterium]